MRERKRERVERRRGGWRKEFFFFFFFRLLSLFLSPLDLKGKKHPEPNSTLAQRPGEKRWIFPPPLRVSELMRGAVAPRRPLAATGGRADAGAISSSFCSASMTTTTTTTAAQRRLLSTSSITAAVACSSSSSSSASTAPFPKRSPLLPPLRRCPQRRDLRSKNRNSSSNETTLGDSLVALAGPAGGGVGSKAGGASGEEVDSPGRLLLVGVGIAYVALILLLPAANVFFQAFRNGVGPFVENVLDPDFIHAVKMTFLMAICAVPINTVWGVAAALLIARNEFRWKPALLSILDLPFSISPVVAGMMLVLLYGRQGLFAPVLKVRRVKERRVFLTDGDFEKNKKKEKKRAHFLSLLFISKKKKKNLKALDIRILYAFPGMVLATLFVTLPYVARELVPVLVRRRFFVFFFERKNRNPKNKKKSKNKKLTPLSFSLFLPLPQFESKKTRRRPRTWPRRRPRGLWGRATGTCSGTSRCRTRNGNRRSLFFFEFFPYFFGVIFTKALRSLFFFPSKLPWIISLTSLSAFVKNAKKTPKKTGGFSTGWS